jgi:hypothetical protein
MQFRIDTEDVYINIDSVYQLRAYKIIQVPN